MHRYMRFEIRGISPLILHNKQLADPCNHHTMEMKKIHSKGSRKMTEEDYRKLAELHWFGSLYLNQESRVVVPGEMIEGMYVAAAKRQRKGTEARAGIVAYNHEDPKGDWPLIYQGPQTPHELWQDERFRKTYIVSGQGAGKKSSKVPRTYPFFQPWSLIYTISFDDELLDEALVRECTRIASTYCGLGDFRPRNGRFAILESEVVNLKIPA